MCVHNESLCHQKHSRHVCRARLTVGGYVVEYAIKGQVYT